MKITKWILPALLLAGMYGCSCSNEKKEPLSKRLAKKTTEIALNAAEGVAEAIEEHGDRVGESMANATGAVATGVGRSLAKQMDEHAETVASVAGRTLVQSLNGLEKGLEGEFYNKFSVQQDLCEHVALEYVGLMKEKPVLDTYLLISEPGTYQFVLDFGSDNCKLISLTKTTTVEHSDAMMRYSAVSFALSSIELEQVKASQCVKLKVSPVAQ